VLLKSLLDAALDSTKTLRFPGLTRRSGRLADLRDQLQETLGSAYTLEHELGGGGMSRVFVAEDTTLARKVVIKLLPPELAAAVNVERFKREIQLAAKLQHPNIVAVLTAGVSEGLPYYTMPFVEGESLRARITREGELPINDVVKILRDVLSALSYAHERGIVHRDIKPDNVLLTKYNAQVTDFGIAKAVTASAAPGSLVTSLGVALGTPAYMAPEQVVADPALDHRADLYSVGAMAYEMLTGSELFGGRSAQATMAAQAIEQPERLELRRPSVPPVLSGLVMRALEKHAADRPQSADEMLQALEALATPGTGTTPQIATQAAASAGKSSRRAIIAGVAAALLIALLAVVVVLQRGRDSTNSPADQPRLAVLPFENGGAPDDAYFVDGMTEAITNRLASISGLSVIGRQSAKRYVGSDKSPQQIGGELGVNYLLTGSVRWDKTQTHRNVVSVRPALLRVADGTQVWGEPYDAVLAGEFKLQSDVAERVARALDVALRPHESRSLATKPTNDPLAYDDYLKGRFFWNKRTAASVQQAVEYFEKALARDPKFARAYAGLAEAYIVMPSYTDASPDSTMVAARENANKAIALDSSLAAPHAVLGTIFRNHHQWTEAEREFKRAMAVEPDYATTYQWYSRMLASLGRFSEAVKVADRARELDPLSPIINLNLGTMQLYGGDYAGADSTLRSTILMDPGNQSSHWTYSTLLTLRQNHPAAIAQIDTAIALTDNAMNLARLSAYRAVARARAGDTAAARAALNEIKLNPRKGELGYELSLLHVSLMEKDSAIKWARVFLEGPFSDPFFFRIPFFDPIRSDPRFQSLMRQALQQ
jgi:TolB-like protein/Tfp pilus assembly protein PilF/tRNA A-37 threonylcarbamoyl transferase component Bud32